MKFPSRASRTPHLASRAGFTLIELLILVGVTIMLSSFLITYNSTGRQQIALYVEETKLAQMILQAKSLTLSTYNNFPPGGAICGYGVHIAYGQAGGSYNLFSYLAPGGNLGACEHLPSFDPAAEVSLPGYAFAFTPGVVFDAASSTMGDVLFVPPDPKTYVVDPSGAVMNTAGVISLMTQNGTAHLNIEINTAGQISF